MRWISTLLLFALPAWAQDGAPPSLPADFQAYLNSPTFAPWLPDFVAAAKKDHFAACDTVTTGPVVHHVVKPVTMGADGLPKQGLWKMSMTMEGCGKARMVNAFFTVDQNGKVVSQMAYPGTTNAEIGLQKETVFYVMMAAENWSQGCDHRRITNTRYEAGEAVGGGALLGAALYGRQATGPQWREVWTVEACGHFLEVTVHYLTSMSATVISTSRDGVTEITPEQAAKATPGS